MSQVTLEIIRGISSAAATAYDGAHDENGEPIKIGLKREEGNPVTDSRVMDGFKVRIDGNKLIVSYQSDIKLKQIYATKFEDELEQTMSDITSYLKKQYKKITKKTLKLKSLGDVDALVQSTSRVRVFVTASKVYEIGGLEDVDDRLEKSEDRLEASFKKFLEQGP
jgi:hypothetical protein